MDWSLAKIGDSAYLKRLNQVVELKTLPDKSGNLFVLVGDMEVKVKSKDLYYTDKKMAKKLNIKHLIESDFIRAVVRGIIGKEYAPSLHSSSYDAYKNIRNKSRYNGFEF